MSDPLASPSPDPTATVAGLARNFPFDVELSLAPLTKFWEREIATRGSLRGKLGRTIQAALREAPELSEAIHDPSVLAKHRDLDYTIYAGASLLEDGAFDPLYLKNLRFSQLMIACGIALRTERLKDRLPVPLEVANLILVQHAPLAIRFRFDEKRFDVDGAYNVRYEIIKKRIDKAVIRGTTERLTQPAKIAVVHSHASEAAEWRDYIEYLQRRGYLTREVEDLELEELPGAQGLRALRVGVDLTASAAAPADLAAGVSSSRIS